MRTTTTREPRRPFADTRTDCTTAAAVVVSVDGGGGVVVADVEVVGVVVLVVGGALVLVTGGVVLVEPGAVVVGVVDDVDVAGVVAVVDVEDVEPVDGAPTEKPPCMDAGCMSQKNVYEPPENVTSQVELPVAGTPEVWSTPGPCRWKEWKLDMSLTFTVYEPGARLVTGEPFWVSEIVNAGPTLASSTGPAAVPAPARTAAAA